ncbi:MAG: outer membrane lipoprotein-sorting protein [Deltaproteobacteria bacterium]|nr:outer membrane lipoprotein-sorting protein [Deltaproteobacteria bacterium]
MRTRHLAVLAFFSLAMALTIFIVIPKAPAKELSAQEILDYVDDLYRGKSSQGRMTMTIVTAQWKRSLSIEFWAKGKENSLMRITAPAKEKGTATLRVGNDMYNYLPKVKRTIKLPSSMMSASWMGSHFTNDDLVKESRFTDDFTFKITGRSTEGGAPVAEITCIPKPDAAVVWGKVVVYARISDYIPLRSLYYDEDGKLARTMAFSELGKTGDRMIPKVLTITPQDKPKEMTVVRYDDIRYDVKLADDLFSLRTLEK